MLADAIGEPEHASTAKTDSIVSLDTSFDKKPGLSTKRYNHINKIVSSNKSLLVFVHGVGGDPNKTWKSFFRVLKADKVLGDWDVLNYGYGGTPLIGFGKSTTLETEAKKFVSTLNLNDISNYKNMVIVAHSVGGLLVQRAILDSEELSQNLSPSRVMFKSGV